VVTLRGERPLSETDPQQGSAGAVYAAYVSQKLADEDARQSSIEQRGLAVITTAGVLTIALFGIATFINPKSGVGIPSAAHGPLVVAMILLLS